jgi:hypothetical protein
MTNGERKIKRQRAKGKNDKWQNSNDKSMTNDTPMSNGKVQTTNQEAKPTGRNVKYQNPNDKSKGKKKKCQMPKLK